jgi:hypothetical protein
MVSRLCGNLSYRFGREQRFLGQQAGGSPDIPKPIDVGMVSLLAAPERYEGK